MLQLVSSTSIKYTVQRTITATKITLVTRHQQGNVYLPMHGLGKSNT